MVEQSEKLDAGRLSIEKEIQERFRLSKCLQDDVAELTVKREDVKTELATILESLEVSRTEVATTQKISRELETECEKLRKILFSLNTDKIAIEKVVCELDAEEGALKISIAGLQGVFKDWQQRAHEAETAYASKINGKEAKIKLLDAKTLKITQDLEERQRVELSTRDDIAKMRREINERDKNLRIREAKVEQGEDKIINNANLMNL